MQAPKPDKDLPFANFSKLMSLFSLVVRDCMLFSKTRLPNLISRQRVIVSRSGFLPIITPRVIHVYNSQTDPKNPGLLIGSPRSS
jgi:hypothetical protein